MFLKNWENLQRISERRFEYVCRFISEVVKINDGVAIIDAGGAKREILLS